MFTLCLLKHFSAVFSVDLTKLIAVLNVLPAQASVPNKHDKPYKKRLKMFLTCVMTEN